MAGQSFRPFTAKDDAPCPRCRVRIRVGNDVIRNNGETVHYPGCPKPWYQQSGGYGDALTPF